MNEQKKIVRKKTFYRWLVSYIIILVITVFTVGCFFYLKTTSIIDKQAVEQYKRKAEKYAQITDSKLGEIKRLAVQLSMTPWVLKTMSIVNDIEGRIDYQEILNISKEISNYIALGDVIDDLSLIFLKNKTVISSFGKDSMEIFFNYNNVYPGDMLESIMSSINMYNYFKVLDSTEVNVFNKKISAIPVIQSLVVDTDRPDASLLVLIDEKAICDFIDNLDTGNESDFFIYNTNSGNIIGKHDSIGLQEDMDISQGKDHMAKTDGILLKTLKSRSSGTGFIREGDDFIYMMASSLAPWKYVFVFPQNAMISQIKSVAVNIVITCILIFLLGLFISVLFTIKNYDPLYRLFLKVAGERVSYRKANDRNEFEIIEDSMNSLLLEKNIIAEKVEKYLPIVRNNRLEQLLKGIFNSDDEGKALLRESELDADSGGMFGVIVLEPPSNAQKPDSEESNAQIIYKKVGVMSEIENIIRNNGIKAQVFESSSDRITVICCFRNCERAEADAGMAKIASDIKKAIREKLQYEICMGIGDIRTGAMGVSKSFQKAQKMLDWIIFTGDDSSNNINRFIDVSDSFYFYPADWEVQIINNLKYGDIGSVKRIIQEIKYENYVKRTLSFDVLRRLLIELIETEMRVIDELNLRFLRDAGEYEKVIYSRTESKMWLFIETMCENICSSVNSMHNKVGLKTGEKLVQYVTENYSSSSLSLKHLSDKFEIPISSISKTFKEATGFNFLDYINRKRIQEAKRLLKETDTEIYIIANNMGYNDYSSFRKVFKKYEGVSPQEYKIALRNSSLCNGG